MRVESEEDREQKNTTIYELNVKMIKGREKENKMRRRDAPLAAEPCLPLSLVAALLLRGPSGPTVATTMVTIPCGNKC